MFLPLPNHSTMKQPTSKRTVTIELTNRQWALLACALSNGCRQLPEADQENAEHIYKVVGDALYPE